jgi:uncharacterized protein with PQ loop repeat
MEKSKGLHHYHKRKRVSEKSLRRKKMKNLMDKLIYVVVFVGPLFTVPQIYKIFVEQNASGISVLTWGAYSLGSLFWLMYGTVHKEKPIIMTNILWALMNFSVMVGALLYK